MGFDAPIEISQADVQIVPGSIYIIDQQTINAIGINFQQEQQDDPLTITMPLYARKPDDIELPKCAQSRVPWIPNPKHRGNISQGYPKSYLNRRLHQDNTRPS